MIHTFPKGICSKVNVMARLEYELAYYDFTVHHFTPRRHPPFMFTNHIYLIYMYKEELALDNLKWFICHKTKPTASSDTSVSLNSLLLYIYIYIYICFVLSELFSVARHARCSKPGSKTIQLYVRLSLRTLGQQADYVG